MVTLTLNKSIDVAAATGVAFRLNVGILRVCNSKKKSLISVSFPIQSRFPSLQFSYNHLTFASLNPNFTPHEPSFLSKFTPQPHHLHTLQYISDNVTPTVGPLLFASLSSGFRSNPIGPALVAKCVEFFGSLKTVIWAFIGAVMSKVYEFVGGNSSGILKASLVPAVAAGVAKWLDIYSGVLMVRILLSWFPNMPWEKQPFSAMRDLCDPFLSLFRSIVPPVFGNLDVSPLLAFAVLGTLGSILGNAQPGPVF